MPPKNQLNTKEVIKDLEKKISPILVVNNSSLKPYIELFDYAPENIYQQPLGSLVGFFEIKEYSEDSAYVVNFLTSVLKKEYYINPKRPVTESLDSALHKVNLALSELAKQGNVEWLGKLNAAICVLEKNNAHFSVAGNAKIFLYRNTGLTEISEDLASDQLEPHPLKTFVNVSSGRVEKDDRMLITSEDIFHIFTALDLKKNLQRFEGEKFVQFLKTALSNQMEMIASMVVEMQEPEIEAPVKKLKKKAPTSANVFSEKTFAQVAVTAEAAIEEGIEVINAPKPETEYTDQKTGHIYVQGETAEPVENPKMAILVESAKEKLGEAWYVTKNETRRKFNIYKKQLAKKLEQRRQEKERLALEREAEMERLREEEELARLENERLLAEENETARVLQEKIEAERMEAESLAQASRQQQFTPVETEAADVKNPRIQTDIKGRKKIIPQIISDETQEDATSEKELTFQEKLQLAIKEQQQSRQAVIDLRTPKKAAPTIEDFFAEKDSSSDVELSVPVHQQAEVDKFQRQEKIEKIKADTLGALEKTKLFATGLIQQTKYFIEKRKASSTEAKPHISPRFSKIKNNFSKFTTKQKIYTLGILALVFIIPFFIARFLNKPAKPVANQLPEKILTQADILAGEKNIKTGISAKTLSAKQDFTSNLLMTDSGLIAFTKNSAMVFDSNGQAKEFPLPAGQGSVSKVAFMSDLSLTLIITDQNKVLSFSPVSQKFTENSINLPGKSANEFFGTYLTYMYVLDPEGGQIYRFPRAEGGFGEKTDWLKSQTQMGKVSSMAIDESIWVADGKQVTKYFKGAPQQIKLESSATTINYDLLYTNLDSTSLYVLDKLNSRIVVFAKDSGNIISQYHSEKFKDAVSFTIDEKNKTAYAITSSGLISVSIQ